MLQARLHSTDEQTGRQTYKQMDGQMQHKYPASKGEYVFLLSGLLPLKKNSEALILQRFGRCLRV